MKLTFAQKVAVVLCLIWFTGCVMGAVSGEKSLTGMAMSATLIPLFILWITGALKPIYQWFKDSH